MAISNGYCTLAEIRQRLLEEHSYTSATISFTAFSKTITDSRHGLKRFQAGDYVQISGSTSNDGYYTIATGDMAASFTVSESLPLDEIAGDTVTITVLNDVTDDAMLEIAVEAVSRWIDEHTGRRFYRNSADETRYYTAENSREFLCPDDIGTLTTLATDADGDYDYGDTWASGDYHLEPFNAAADGNPYTRIRVTPSGNYTFPSISKGVKLVGKFGYAATTPPAIKAACMLQVARLFKRGDAPFGVMGSAELGQLQVIPKLDPDVKLLLAPYVRYEVGGV